MLSISLSNFLLMGGAVFPPCYLTRGQTTVEVMEIMATSFRGSHAGTAARSARTLQQVTPPPGAPGHSRAIPGQSPVGPLLLSPGSWCTRFVCALQETIPQSCVSSGSSMVGLMATSSKRAYARPRSAAPRAPVPAADHRRPIPPQETLKHSLSGSLWGPCVLVRTRLV